MKLCLVHTADMHNRLSDALAVRLAGLKRRYRALLLDSGDAVAAANICPLPWPEPAIRRMNAAEYDAMCVGNREYMLRRWGFCAKTAQARFPVLSANILPRRGTLGHIARWTVLAAADGVRVGVFGLTEVMVRPGSFWSRFADTYFLPPKEAAREALAALRGQCDVVVCLAHFGRGDEGRILQAVEGIDIALCGHIHVPEPSLEMVGQSALARTFHHAAGAAVLHYDGRKWTQEAVRL